MGGVKTEEFGVLLAWSVPDSGVELECVKLELWVLERTWGALNGDGGWGLVHEIQDGGARTPEPQSSPEVTEWAQLGKSGFLEGLVVMETSVNMERRVRA